MMYQTLLNPKFRVYEFKSNYVIFIKYFFIIYFRMHVTRLTPLMCHAFISMQLVNYSRLRMLFDYAFDNCGIDNASMKRILIKDVMMYQTLLNPKFRVYEFKSNYVIFIKQFLHYLFSYALDETNAPYSRLRMLFDFAFDHCEIDNSSMKRILIRDVMIVTKYRTCN